MKLINGKITILGTFALIMAAIFVIGCAIYFFILTARSDLDATRGERPFTLNQRELSTLDLAAKHGDCAAAYKVAQFHLYSTLQMQQAETYYRLAAKCSNPDALVGLITVLRKPEYDVEIDEFLASLKRLDQKKWAAASEDVALRRAERKTQ